MALATVDQRMVEGDSEGNARSPVAAGIVAPAGFRPDVQALRGVAVLAVVAYHAGGLLPGGFVGVDMFFVISGFVIGRVLIQRFFSDGRLGAVGFYTKRARRLLPALAVLLVTVVLVSPFLAPLSASSVTPRTGLAASLFSSNLYLLRATGAGYFTTSAEVNPLLHIWSLSLEEQFYFVVPIVLLVGWIAGRRVLSSLTTLRVVVIGIIVVSLVANLVFSFGGLVLSDLGLRVAFFSPVTRAWEFAIGIGIVLLPAALFQSRALRRQLFLPAGFLLVAVSLILFDREMTFPGVAALVPVVGTALLIAAGTERTVSDRGSSSSFGPLQGPLAWFGDVSYSWYLWHWPLIVFAAALFPLAGPIPLVAAAVVSLLPAIVSYRLVENRFRHRDGHRGGGRTGALIAVCIVVPILASLGSIALWRVVQQQPMVRDAQAAFAGHLGGGKEFCDNDVPLADRDPAVCEWGPVDAEFSVAVLGDSQAGQLSEAVAGAAEQSRSLIRLASNSACPPFSTEIYRNGRPQTGCREFLQQSVADLEADPPDVVFLSGAGAYYVFDDRFAFGEGGIPITVPDDKLDIARDAYRQVIERLRDAGSRVVIVAPVRGPLGWERGLCSSAAVWLRDDSCLPPDHNLTSSPDYLTWVQVERDLAVETGSRFFDPLAFLCDGTQCPGGINGEPVWRDEGHISVAASERLVGPFTDLLNETADEIRAEGAQRAN